MLRALRLFRSEAEEDGGGHSWIFVAREIVATALTFGGYRDGIGPLVEQDASSKTGPMFEIACNGGLSLGCLARASDLRRR